MFCRSENRPSATAPPLSTCIDVLGYEVDNVKKKTKKKAKKLSLGELRVMGILWEQGPLTLADAYELQSGDLGYTTIQTQLNRLVEKGVAARSKSRPMKYRALIDPSFAAEGLLQILIETVGRGSIVPLVEQLIARQKLTSEMADQLRGLIDQAAPKRAKQRVASKKRGSKTA